MKMEELRKLAGLLEATDSKGHVAVSKVMEHLKAAIKILEDNSDVIEKYLEDEKSDHELNHFVAGIEDVLQDLGN